MTYHFNTEEEKNEHYKKVRLLATRRYKQRSEYKDKEKEYNKKYYEAHKEEILKKKNNDNAIKQAAKLEQWKIKFNNEIKN